MVASVAFLVGCFVSIGYAGVNNLDGREGEMVQLQLLVGTTAVILAIVALLALVIFHRIIWNWWHEPEDEERLPEKDWVPAPELTWESDVPRAKGDDDVA